MPRSDVGNVAKRVDFMIEDKIPCVCDELLHFDYSCIDLIYSCELTSGQPEESSQVNICGFIWTKRSKILPFLVENPPF
jgi:hypothetical protein